MYHNLVAEQYFVALCAWGMPFCLGCQTSLSALSLVQLKKKREQKNKTMRNDLLSFICHFKITAVVISDISKTE